MQKPSLTEEDMEGAFYLLLAGMFFSLTVVGLIIYLIFCQ